MLAGFLMEPLGGRDFLNFFYNDYNFENSKIIFVIVVVIVDINVDIRGNVDVSSE